jgi:hypothetical protein
MSSRKHRRERGPITGVAAMAAVLIALVGVATVSALADGGAGGRRDDADGLPTELPTASSTPTESHSATPSAPVVILSPATSDAASSPASTSPPESAESEPSGSRRHAEGSNRQGTGGQGPGERGPGEKEEGRWSRESPRPAKSKGGG